jgi:hypothetical protein
MDTLDQNDAAEAVMVLKLKKPLTDPGKGTVDELRLEEPTCGQWLLASTFPGAEAELQLLAAVTGVTPNSLKRMAISDFVKASSFLSGFARVSPIAGPT